MKKMYIKPESVEQVVRLEYYLMEPSTQTIGDDGPTIPIDENDNSDPDAKGNWFFEDSND
ncbi:MAG: hypothetical protein SOZ80_08810 [Prevotella sp.]|uniref:hypothetical protein n=1 Tax=Prevotella sp. TaxID=59823 RepID=UPI002A291CA5|nr:hypothetical protein [Prevotella sp.]MDD7319314.1 hypothetical protein [Prevotellaceae bacterium]MDY4020856.1 hypothetical protein [Prevotella sp.]